MDIVVNQLCRVVKTSDPSTIENTPRCEALLNDYCSNGHKRKISALVGAVKLGIPSAIRGGSADSMDEAALRLRYVQRLARDTGIEVDLARWSVGAWYVALGKAAASDALESHDADDLLTCKLNGEALKLFNALCASDVFQVAELWRLHPELQSEPGLRPYGGQIQSSLRVAAVFERFVEAYNQSPDDDVTLWRIWSSEPRLKDAEFVDASLTAQFGGLTIRQRAHRAGEIISMVATLQASIDAIEASVQGRYTADSEGQIVAAWLKCAKVLNGCPAAQAVRQRAQEAEARITWYAKLQTAIAHEDDLEVDALWSGTIKDVFLITSPVQKLAEAAVRRMRKIEEFERCILRDQDDDEALLAIWNRGESLAGSRIASLALRRAPNVVPLKRAELAALRIDALNCLVKSINALGGPPYHIADEEKLVRLWSERGGILPAAGTAQVHAVRQRAEAARARCEDWTALKDALATDDDSRIAEIWNHGYCATLDDAKRSCDRAQVAIRRTTTVNRILATIRSTPFDEQTILAEWNSEESLANARIASNPLPELNGMSLLDRCNLAKQIFGDHTAIVAAIRTAQANLVAQLWREISHKEHPLFVPLLSEIERLSQLSQAAAAAQELLRAKEFIGFGHIWDDRLFPYLPPDLRDRRIILAALEQFWASDTVFNTNPDRVTMVRIGVDKLAIRWEWPRNLTACAISASDGRWPEILSPHQPVTEAEICSRETYHERGGWVIKKPMDFPHVCVWPCFDFFGELRAGPRPLQKRSASVRYALQVYSDHHCVLNLWSPANQLILRDCVLGLSETPFPTMGEALTLPEIQTWDCITISASAAHFDFAISDNFHRGYLYFFIRNSADAGWCAIEHPPAPQRRLR